VRLHAAEWRFLRGWSTSELRRRLRHLPALPPTAPAFDDPDAVVSTGAFREYHSEADVAREQPGPPSRGGAFERGRTLLARYEFSHPGIVTGHFDRDAPLLGRPMLLEIKVLGLRYLGPVSVGAVRDEAGGGRSVFGFRYDTLVGHLEAGAEWFLLTKDHATGEVRLRIHALWRPGQFPNWWSRVGFHLLARRHQRAWHRLAYARLRVLLRADGLPPLPRAGALLHEGSPLPRRTRVQA
jgi:uncharacterized protein (UPF0548 family)